MFFRNGLIYLLDICRVRLEMLKLVRKAIELGHQYPTDHLSIVDKPSGGALVLRLQDAGSGRQFFICRKRLRFFARFWRIARSQTSIASRMTKPATTSPKCFVESVRGRGESGAASLDTALSSFKGATRTKPYKEPRKAELLIKIGRAAESEAILANIEELETSCWT